MHCCAALRTVPFMVRAVGLAKYIEHVRHAPNPQCENATEERQAGVMPVKALCAAFPLDLALLLLPHRLT